MACLAMATGESYEAIFSSLNTEARESLGLGEGLYWRDDLELLDLLKFEYESYYPEPGDGWSSTCKRAILQVPSKNFENKKHALFWDGESILDPSNMLTYDTEEGLGACDFVLKIWMPNERHTRT